MTADSEIERRRVALIEGRIRWLSGELIKLEERFWKLKDELYTHEHGEPEPEPPPKAEDDSDG